MSMAPHIPSVSGVTWLQAVALAPAVGVVILQNPAAHLVLLASALATALFWEGLFSALRRRNPTGHGLTTALIVAVMVPADVALWQVAFTLSLGVILAELIFGGRGFGFVQSATLALALLLISFPGVQLAAPSQDIALATLPGAVLLLAVGLISWEVLVACILGLIAALAATGMSIDPTAIATGLAFGLVFLICDPVAAAVTGMGRWIYGALAGALIVVFSASSPLSSEALVYAALMSTVFVPLIDHLVVLAHARARGRSHA